MDPGQHPHAPDAGEVPPFTMLLSPLHLPPTPVLSRIASFPIHYSVWSAFDQAFFINKVRQTLEAYSVNEGDQTEMLKMVDNFLTITHDDCIGLVSPANRSLASQACRFTLRINRATDKPICSWWHRDAPMFDPCSCKGLKQPHCKYAVSLLGPSTLVLEPSREVDQIISEHVYPKESLGNAMENEDFLRSARQLAEKLAHCERVPTSPTGQIIRFTCGEEDSPVHSTPDRGTGARLFMAVVYGNKDEIYTQSQQRMDMFGICHARTWIPGADATEKVPVDMRTCM